MQVIQENNKQNLAKAKQAKQHCNFEIKSLFYRVKISNQEAR